MLLIDEAHTLDLDVGLDLFDAWQSLSPRHRIMLVMAGTPDLVDHVNEMGATYASRSEKILLGRMPTDGAREALLAPLRESGVELTPGQEKAALEGCQRYPFFVQVWGEKLWRAAREAGAPSPTDDQFQDALLKAAQVREAYYAARREELYRMDLSAPARAWLTSTTAPKPPSANQRLCARCRKPWAKGHQTGVRRRPDATEALRPRVAGAAAGGRPENQPNLWEAGIPSLMANIRANSPGPSGE